MKQSKHIFKCWSENAFGNNESSLTLTTWRIDCDKDELACFRVDHAGHSLNTFIKRKDAARLIWTLIKMWMRLA